MSKPAKIPKILLRNVPEDVFKKIGKKKTEILKKNKYRGRVSHEDAIYKLINECNPL